MSRALIQEVEYAPNELVRVFGFVQLTHRPVRIGLVPCDCSERRRSVRIPRTRPSRPQGVNLEIDLGCAKLAFEEELHDVRGLPGKPDLAFTRWKIAVFVDGAFWHGHPDHFEFGKLEAYWDDKIRRTQERDRVQQADLEAAGWVVVRFWDFEGQGTTEKLRPDRAEALRQADHPSA